MKKFLLLSLIFFSQGIVAMAETVTTIHVVAAENFYGDVSNQLGKPYVEVTSIINNVSQDPHTFSINPRIAITIDRADIIIENGLGYDAWMSHFYTKASLINVGNLMHKKVGMNPHIWYDPKTMPVLARAFVKELIKCDPAHKQHYQKNLKSFLRQARHYQSVIRKDREKFGWSEKNNKEFITATEPIANYLTDALGLNMLNKKFQQDVMNGSDLTPAEIMQFEQSLKNVKLFIYNQQVIDPTVINLKNLAIKNNVPVEIGRAHV